MADVNKNVAKALDEHNKGIGTVISKVFTFASTASIADVVFLGKIKRGVTLLSVKIIGNTNATVDAEIGHAKVHSSASWTDDDDAFAATGTAMDGGTVTVWDGAMDLTADVWITATIETAAITSGNIKVVVQVAEYE